MNKPLYLVAFFVLALLSMLVFSVNMSRDYIEPKKEKRVPLESEIKSDISQLEVKPKELRRINIKDKKPTSALEELVNGN